MLENTSEYTCTKLEGAICHEKYLALWQELISGLPAYFINLHPEWLKAWENYRQENIQALEIRKNRLSRGIMLFYWRNRKIKGLIRYTSIYLAGTPDADWSDVLIKDADYTAFEHLMKGILKNNPNKIVFQNVHAESPFLKYLKASELPYSLSIREQTKCYYIQTSGSWEDYLKTQTSKQFVRQDIRRLTRRLEDSKNEMKIVESDLSDPESDLSVLKKLHALSQYKQDRKSWINMPSGEQFIRQLINNLGQEAQLRIRYLMLNGRPAAYIVAFYFKKTFFYWNIGFDPDFQNFSPSKILLFHTLKQCFEDQTKEFNFMRGDSYYKTKWTHSYRINYELKLFSTRGLAGWINKLKKAN